MNPAELLKKSDEIIQLLDTIDISEHQKLIILNIAYFTLLSKNEPKIAISTNNTQTSKK